MGKLLLQNKKIRKAIIDLTIRDQDIWEKDPKGLYGMKPEYLSTLKITPPIGNWVHVTNFRCDKSELRDAFELAGNVVACSIINAKDKCGKIMYSHPLEAVQAISMLHGQVFYGLKLNVVMDKVANSQILLPKGLLSIGPGLGEDGSAVRQIIWEYERFLKGKATRINRSLFTAGNVNGIVVSQKTSYAVFEPKDKTDTPTPIPPVVSSSNPIPSVRPTIKPPRPSFRNMGPPVPQDPGHYRFPNSPMFRGPMPRGPMGPMGPIGPMGEMCSPGPFHCAFPPGPTRMPMPFGPRPPGSMHHAGPIHPLGPIHPPGPIRPPIPMVAPMSKSSPNWGKKMPQMIKCADSTTLKISNKITLQLISNKAESSGFVCPISIIVTTDGQMEVK